MKLLRQFLIVVVCVALVLAGSVVAFYLLEDFRGGNVWAAAQHEVQMQGGTTDYAAIIPPSIPDDQNLAMAPLFAKALDYHVDPATRQLTFGNQSKDKRLDGIPYGTAPSGQTPPTSSGGWERGRTLDLAAWQKYYRADAAFPRTPEPQSPAADVLLALSRYGVPLDELAQAVATRPLSRFPINWNHPSVYMISLRQANLLLQFAGTLRLRASAELANGNPAAALADIALVFRLSDALQGDSLVIDHLANVTILGLVAQPIWEGLAARSWNASEVARLQAALTQKDVLTDYAHAMRCEEASAGRGLDFLERHADGKDILRIVRMGEPTNLSFGERLFYGFVGVAPRGWYDQNKARIVRYDQSYLVGATDPAAHRVFPSKLAEGVAARSQVRVGAYTLFFLLEAPAFDNFLPRSARTQVICDQAAIACALERFFLDHGTYPVDLTGLVPGYLGRLPTDVIDGASMRYRRTPDGRYLLYSIGWNGRDDGGQVAWKPGPRLDYLEGDWVWQYQPLPSSAKLLHDK